MITGYIFSFILAPIMLARLGLEVFGIWAVTGAFATYALLMDFGITRSLERFVAYYNAHGDRRSVEQCVGLGVVAVTAVGTVAALAAALAAPLVTEALGAVLSAADMRVVLLCSVSIMVLNAYSAVMRSVPLGLQLQVPPSLALIAANTINFAFSLAALAASDELVVYAAANAAAGVVALGPMALALRKTWSPVRVRFPSRAITREVLGFSVKAQVAWVSDLINNQTDKIIIGLFIDVRAAGAYEIANRVVLALKAVAVMSVSALTAASTRGLVEQGRAMVPGFYRYYTRRALSVALPLMIFTCAASPVLLVAWLGEVPEEAVAVVVILTLANCINLSTGVASTVSMGDGRAGAIANVAMLVVVVNILATLALTPLFGLWGVLAGTAIAVVIGAVVFLVYFHRLYEIAPGVYLKAVGGPALLAATAALPIVLWQVLGAIALDDRLPAFAMTFAFLLVYIAVYWPIASSLDMLPERLALRRVRRLKSVHA